MHYNNSCNINQYAKFNTAVLCILVSIIHSACTPLPDTDNLDADIRQVQQSIASVESRISQYSGGAILTLLELQLEYHKTALSALELKRNSWLNFVELKLDWVVEPPHCLEEYEIKQLHSDIEETARKLELAKFKAESYSGGLIQGITLMEAATHELTLASLKYRLLSNKYGLPIIPPAINSTEKVLTKDEVEYFDEEAL